MNTNKCVGREEGAKRKPIKIKVIMVNITILIPRCLNFIMAKLIKYLGRDVMASLEPRFNMKSLLAKRNSKQTPKIEGLSYNKYDSEEDEEESETSMGRKLSSEHPGTMRPFYRKLDETQNDGR